jgi:catechol 2,3-dioxygenase
MKIGTPILKVKNISKVLDFYQKYLGLQVNNKKDDDNSSVYELGFKNLSSSNTNISPLLTLRYIPHARNAPSHSAGLYHFAILVPDRISLASTYSALRDSGVRYDGFADHLVSESLYLRDPENNGIEIYHDRPSREWLRDSAGDILMDTLPLNLDALVSEMNEEEIKSSIAFPTGARIGHMHLKVTNLERSINFTMKK